MNILITGAVSGIASCTAKKLIKNKKNTIYLTVRTDEQVKTAKDKFKNNENVKCFKLDITSLDDRKLVEELDIDILICNAAVNYGGSIAEISMDKVRENFEVNVFSTFELVQLVLKKMIQKGKGRIIMISSIAGIVPIKFLGVYSATKSSITTLTTTLRKELKLLNKNIDVILIEPGLYRTGFNQVMIENKYDWMIKDSYFKNQLNDIKLKEKLMLDLLEKRDLKSITNKIMHAIYSNNPKDIYKAPISQALMSKIYQIFKS